MLRAMITYFNPAHRPPYPMMRHGAEPSIHRLIPCAIRGNSTCLQIYYGVIVERRLSDLPESYSGDLLTDANRRNNTQRDIFVAMHCLAGPTNSRRRLALRRLIAPWGVSGFGFSSIVDNRPLRGASRRSISRYPTGGRFSILGPDSANAGTAQ